MFKKLIPQRILKIEKDNNVDVTGSQQHGFKKGCSTNMYTCPGLAPFKVNFKAYSLCNSHFPFV
jgi:hypothetical protein